MKSTRNEITTSPRKKLKMETQSTDNNSGGAIEMSLCNSITIQMMLDAIKAKAARNVQNIVSSPMSINLLLNMLAIGFKKGSTGQIDLMNALEVKSADEINSVSSRLMALMNKSNSRGSGRGRGPTLSMANGVWSDFNFPIKPKFHEIATQIYRADTRSFDFAKNLDQVIDNVNSRAKNETKGLIKNLISPGSLDPSTVLILANALYFKGTWLNKFLQSETRDRLFYLSKRDGTTVKVPFMNMTRRECHGSFEGFSVLKLPYQSGRDGSTKKLSMYVFLPNTKTGLANLLKIFISDPSLVGNKCMNLRSKLCAISIPKFKILFSFTPSKIMSEMGLDLSKMGKLTNIVGGSKDEKNVATRLSMIQKSHVEVNEQGTEAASATYGGYCVGASSSGVPRPPKPIIFVADHPFFFTIKDDTSGATLFTGTVRNPMLKH